MKTCWPILNTYFANETPIGSFPGLQDKKANYMFIADLPENANASAGICTYGTNENGTGLSVKNGNIELWQVKKENCTILATKPADAYPLSRCLRTQFGQYCQLRLIKQNNFQMFGELNCHDKLPQWNRLAIIGIQKKGKVTTYLPIFQ